DDAQRQRVVHGFEAALRLLDETCRVYQYLCKRRIKPMDAAPCVHPVAAEAIQRRVDFLNGRRTDLYAIGLYLVLVQERLGSQIRRNKRWTEIWRHPRQAVGEWLSNETAFALLDTAIDQAARRLAHKASAFEVQLADSVRPRRLRKADAFTFFRGLANYAPHKVSGAALRYTAMIVLPEGEEILDVVVGDGDFWVISATQNIAHVKPAKEGAATNLNLVTASGTVYSFLLRASNKTPVRHRSRLNALEAPKSP